MEHTQWKEWNSKFLEPMAYQTKPGKGGKDQNYIDARQVMYRLDEVCGAENWQCDYKEIKGNIYCTISVRYGYEWVSKCDCGTESQYEAEKGESSDAFKRAAVKFGIGRFLYDSKLPKMSVGKTAPVVAPAVKAAEEVFKPVQQGTEAGVTCKNCAATLTTRKEIASYPGKWIYECKECKGPKGYPLSEWVNK